MNKSKYIVIDLREFHPIIKQELLKYGFLSPRVITEDDALMLIDPVVATLLYLRNNLDVVNGVGRRSYLFHYYKLDDFIEIFDDLQIAFGWFLELNGINRVNDYHVFRPDNFRTVFVQYEKILHF